MKNNLIKYILCSFKINKGVIISISFIILYLYVIILYIIPVYFYDFVITAPVDVNYDISLEIIESKPAATFKINVATKFLNLFSTTNNTNNIILIEELRNTFYINKFSYSYKLDYTYSREKKAVLFFIDCLLEAIKKL